MPEFEVVIIVEADTLANAITKFLIDDSGEPIRGILGIGGSGTEDG